MTTVRWPTIAVLIVNANHIDCAETTTIMVVKRRSSSIDSFRPFAVIHVDVREQSLAANIDPMQSMA